LVFIRYLYILGYAKGELLIELYACLLSTANAWAFQYGVSASSLEEKALCMPLGAFGVTAKPYLVHIDYRCEDRIKVGESRGDFRAIW
jgi:hypothetical protein